MKQLRFDVALRGAILLLALGGLGGSLQPSRAVLLVIGIPALVMLAGQGSLRTRVAIGAVLMALTLLCNGALSLTWSPALADGASLWVVVAVGLLALPIACMCNPNLATARQIRDAWSWAMAATLPFAMYELATGEHLAYALDDRNLGGDVGTIPFASVFFGNYNNYCAFICLALPMMLGTLDGSLRRSSRWFWASCIVLTYLVLVINTSRLSLIFSALLLVYYISTRKSWRRPFALLIAAGGVAVWLGYFAEEFGSILSLATLKFDILGAGDESVGQRAGMIAAGLQQLSDSFGMGFGIGSFEHHLRLDHPELIPNAHNLVIELATNFGTVATLGFLLFLGQLFVASWRGTLPRDLRTIPLLTLPFVPAIGAINSQAVGYTYWWLWLATVLVIAASGERRALRVVSVGQASRTGASVAVGGRSAPR